MGIPLCYKNKEISLVAYKDAVGFFGGWHIVGPREWWSMLWPDNKVLKLRL